MERSQLEDVNGTLMLAVPASIIDRLQLAAGSEVEVDVQDESLMLRASSRRGRCNLEQMLADSDPAAFERTEEDWEFLNSPPVGRELI